MVIYRIVIFILLMAITYYFTGDLTQTTTISTVFNLAGSVIYYLFERMWGKIEWGMTQSPALAEARLSQRRSTQSSARMLAMEEELRN